MTQKILFLVTSHSDLGDTGQPTGLYLPEFAHPYEAFSKSGYSIEVASPHGGSAPIDPKSTSEELALYTRYVQQTIPLKDIDPKEYDAFFVVGGHGVMWDLPNNLDVQRILVSAFEQGKILAAVCHGPAALVNLCLSNGHSLLQGRQVTGFSNNEEATIGLTHVMPFLLEDALKKAGADYTCMSNWQAHVVIDGQLITGQNPASALEISQAVINSLSSLPL